MRPQRGSASIRRPNKGCSRWSSRYRRSSDRDCPSAAPTIIQAADAANVVVDRRTAHFHTEVLNGIKFRRGHLRECGVRTIALAESPVRLPLYFLLSHLASVSTDREGEQMLGIDRSCRPEPAEESMRTASAPQFLTALRT